MTTATVAVPQARGRAPVSWVVSDALAMTRRNLLRYVRLPNLLVFSTIQPVMFVLLFAYVFGGAIKGALPPGVPVRFRQPDEPAVLGQAQAGGVAVRRVLDAELTLLQAAVDERDALGMERVRQALADHAGQVGQGLAGADVVH